MNFSFTKIQFKKMITVEYIWIGGRDTHTDLRSKVRRISVPNFTPNLSYIQLNEQYLSKIPIWNFDGSSGITGMTKINSEDDTEIILKPVAICNDPFRKDSSLWILAECCLSDEQPHESNTRYDAASIFQQYENEHPWYGLEQEYVMIDPKTERPLGWTRFEQPENQGKNYCGNGYRTVFRRDLLEKHFQACIEAGLTVSGYNAEVMPGQYEFQIGPVEGIAAADQLIFARFILLRIAEEAQLIVSYSPKPIKGNWNGSGLHHNFSTKRMREEGGYDEIEKVIQELERRHSLHLRMYGEDNQTRLTGKHETSSFIEFSYGVGTRNTSVRIPNESKKFQKGYFEDRRPSANCDPYHSTSILMQAVERRLD
jgi:glutamine synthetase